MFLKKQQDALYRTQERPLCVTQPLLQRKFKCSDSIGPSLVYRTISTSDRRFRFADGSTDEAQTVVEQPITVGLLTGKYLSMHLIDKAGNDTCPLLSINDLRRLRMVVDYEKGKIMFKDNLDVWHKLPTTKKGLMMNPLTR